MRSLGLVERFWLDAEGQPGDRTFYAVVVSDQEALWFVAEKDQVATLARRSLELLSEAGMLPDADAVERISERTAIGQPGDPTFRIGTMAMAIDPDAEIIRIAFEPADEDGDGISFDLVPEQLVAAAEHGLTVVAAGRPICPRCRLPEDPAGHDCPAVNGHRY